MLNKRITLEQVQTSETFFKVPKNFEKEDSPYNKMSVFAKYLYALMKDRFELSLKNKWVDKNNHVYIYFTLQEIQDIFECGKNKAVALKKELTDYGLLEEETQGFQKPNRIYVLNLSESVGPQNQTSLNDSDSKASSEVSKINPQWSQKQTSRGLKNKPLGVSKSNPNKTNINNTNRSKTKESDEDEKKNKSTQEISDEQLLRQLHQEIGQFNEQEQQQINELLNQVDATFFEPRDVYQIVQALLQCAEHGDFNLLQFYYRDALEFTDEHCKSPDYFAQYLCHRLLADKEKRELIRRNKEIQENNREKFVIPMDGPWNNEVEGA